MTSVDGKGTAFLVKMKLDGSCLNKDIKKMTLKKDLINLRETIYQINMTSGHFVSRNKLFKNHLNTKNFNMLLTLSHLCQVR